MAEGVILFGIEKLWDLVSRESEQFQGVHEQVSELKRQLGRLQSLLKDADAKKHESERVRNFLEDIKDIVYDAEDIIETFLMKEGRRKEKGIKKRVTKLASILVDRPKIVSDVKGINKRISDVISSMQSFGILQMIECGRSLSLEDNQRELRHTYPNNSENDLVGMDQSVEDLVAQLVGNDNIQVVSISGMGGIGKTTLARQVFHHDRVRRHFDGFAWICVSQQFTQKHVWQRILQELRPDDGEILEMDEFTRQGKLFQLLETDKYLIVLDDIWKAEDWDRIKEVFPQKRGWKMLLTSRNESVGLHADPTCFSFRPKTLTLEQSWTLCQRLAFPRRGEAEYIVDEELEIMGKEMVTYCGGLPLAVKVLGGLLATKHTVLEWKRVHENIGLHIIGGSGLNFNSVYRVLSLSYEDLPMGLKHCFLYFAHFPEAYKIDVETLFNYWAAEGVVMIDRGTIRDNAEGYLEELVRRNMVISERNYLTSRIESCHMHDIMRGVCLSKAEEENFLQIVKVPTSTSTISGQSSRRLAVHSSKAFEMMGHEKTKKVRSLLYFKTKEEALIQSFLDFGSLPFLRVLDLSRVKFQGGKLPSSIGELIHLRFLSLYRAGVSYLPSSLRNLKLLLYLNLGVHGVSVHVPNVLKELRELRYLILPFLMDVKTKLELGDLVNLETLSGYSLENSSVKDLRGMTNLRTLTIHSLNGCTLETLSSSLFKSRELEQLSLYEVMHDGHNEGKLVLDSVHLKVLTVGMHIPRLLEQHRFPPNLAHICLRYCCMEEDPMPILEKLLHLKWVELSYRAFTGKRMVCSKGGFPQLHVLKLSGLYDLEDWVVEEGSMWCLRTLTINECRSLKEPPDGLKYLTSLKEMTIAGMYMMGWKEKLSEGGQNYYKVQHIPRVQYMREYAD
ncbi:PREDICTED: probable disease resistance RPP8-like protein 2 [Camelina sativa]|uniref:Probable disease resistance RPP8-like protein 2 n=1 Tax=Camelina sativa TaxID=90675 RepID=A0ABM0V2K5_CAMSA|nr:PREDICTED: probable disease resistance RPP8-like protein 2 [Camelina sativa]XP_019089619.1 PREDICTED: probable disease resistance RPP8-like protein 2 [Camelina sativa]